MKPASREMRGLVVGLGVVIAAGMGVQPASATPTFTFISTPLGARSIAVRGISDDGRVVVGDVSDSMGRACGFRWR